MIEEYIWKKCNYKLMLGKWRIAIMLEAGYQILQSAEPKDGCTKLTDRICFQNMLLPYPSSQPLTVEELDYFCRGLKRVSDRIENAFPEASCLMIALRAIQFSDCDIQSEAFTASAIQWASETFQFPLPDIRVHFDDSKGRNGMYGFDFYGGEKS